MAATPKFETEIKIQLDRASKTLDKESFGELLLSIREDIEFRLDIFDAEEDEDETDCDDDDDDDSELEDDE